LGPGNPSNPAEIRRMLAFRDHFLDKYFGYRRRYVEAVAAIAPERRSLAVASEVARLAFSIVANALCAGIFWLLFAAAIHRAGGFGVWPALFGTLAALPTTFGLMAIRAVVLAFADRRSGA
jgi:hypothetical protein